MHAKLRNRTCQGLDRQGQGQEQGQGLTSLFRYQRIVIRSQNQLNQIKEIYFQAGPFPYFLPIILSKYTEKTSKAHRTINRIQRNPQVEERKCLLNSVRCF